MKKVFIGVFVVALVLFFSSLSPMSNAAEKVIEMKIASPFTNATTNGYYPEWLSNELKRRGSADGRLDIKCYSNAQLGGETELFNKLKAGAIHLTINSFAVMTTFSDVAALGWLPFLLDTDEKAHKFINSPMAAEMAKAMEPQGVKNLGWLTFGRFCINGKKPIRKLEDMKGMKVRIAKSPIMLAIFQAMGIQPTPIPWAEAYEALKRGVVDGLDMAIEPVWGTKMYEVVKYSTETSHTYGLNFIFVNKKWFENLPPVVQQFISDTVRDVSVMEQYNVLQVEKWAKKDFKRKGITIIPLSAEERKPFIKATLSVHKQYADRIGRDLLRRTYELVKFPYAKEVLGN